MSIKILRTKVAKNFSPIKCHQKACIIDGQIKVCKKISKTRKSEELIKDAYKWLLIKKEEILFNFFLAEVNDFFIPIFALISYLFPISFICIFKAAMKLLLT